MRFSATSRIKLQVNEIFWALGFPHYGDAWVGGYRTLRACGNCLVIIHNFTGIFSNSRIMTAWFCWTFFSLSGYIRMAKRQILFLRKLGNRNKNCISLKSLHAWKCHKWPECGKCEVAKVPTTGSELVRSLPAQARRSCRLKSLKIRFNRINVAH